MCPAGFDCGPDGPSLRANLEQVPSLSRGASKPARAQFALWQVHMNENGVFMKYAG